MNNDEIKLPGAYGRSFGSRGKLQDLDGICDTLVAAMGKGGGNVPIITEETHDMNNKFTKNKNVDQNIYFDMVAESGCEIPCAVDEQNVTIRKDGTVGTITTNGSSAKRNNRVIVEEPFIVASRGRNPENPSDRTPGAPTEQRLEPNKQGITNTLTTVQKDNLVAEPQIIEDFYKSRGERVYDEYSPALRSDRSGLKVNTTLRIRKLTPKECFRLMGFDDDAFSKAEAVNSNTQLYKQAGNSIVVNVLEHLFRSLQESLPDVVV